LRFDDRLQTMLDAPVADSRDRAVRWRQLVDLLSRMDPAESAVAASALDIIAQDAFTVDEDVRAATVRAIAGRVLPRPLLRILAAQPVRIAAPLFAGMTIGAAEADDLLGKADPEVRSLITVEPDERGAEQEIEAAATSAATIPEKTDEWIEQPPRERTPAMQSQQPPAASPRSMQHPAEDREVRMFEWESDATGHIAWVEGAPRGALVGRTLGGDTTALLERQASTRLGQRHPFVDVPLTVGDALEGRWSGTGVPAFDPATGRFLGYRGLARRTDGADPPAQRDAEPDLDALRELVHEIKTPLNAIIGFAEIIDGQYLGPAHRNYRVRAANIVGQARKLLEAVEDLDLAAKLRAERFAGRASGGEGGAIALLLPPIVADLERCLASSGGILDMVVDDQRHRCALSGELVSRLIRRLCLSLCELVGADEIFRIAVTRRGAMCLMTIARPHSLSGVPEVQMVDPAFSPALGAAAAGGEPNGVGLGFALRLVRGLAKVAGGGLAIEEHRITLELPAAEG
jgi:hypothetical protein